MSAAQALQKRYFDQSYVSKLAELELYFQLSKNYLHAAFFSQTDQQFVGFEEYYLGENDNWSLCLEKLRPVIQDFPKVFKKVQLCISTHRFTLIPQALFSEEATANYLELNHQGDFKKSEVLSNNLSSASVVIAFEVPFLLQNLFKAHFTLSGIFHEGAPLLEYHELEKNFSANLLHVHVQYNHFHICYFNEKGLNYFNRFEYSTVEDFMYYLLYVMEQLKLDRENIDLQVRGEIEKQSSLFEMLYKYIRKVEIAPRPKRIPESQVLSQLGESYFFNLFNQYLCES